MLERGWQDDPSAEGFPMLDNVWQFMQDAAPEWSTRFHIPIVLAVAIGLLLLSIVLVWLTRRKNAKGVYARYKRTKW